MEDNERKDFHSLSWSGKLVRTYYRAVEVMLDRDLIDYVLVESYRRFTKEGEDYPFVRPGELKPGGMGEVGEYANHNSALVLLLESELDPGLKTNIRARRPQEVVQKNLQRYLFRSGQSLDKIALIRDIEQRARLEQMRPLFALDYGLLIQPRIGGAKGRLNYAFTHFHVKIDEVLDRVIEQFGVDLRYLTRSLYEQGEDYAAVLEEKFFEVFGMKSTAAGRRTAAVVAHSLLKRNEGLHAVYVGSTEARSLIKIRQDDHVIRTVLVEVDAEMRKWLTATHGVTADTLQRDYLLPDSERDVAIMSVHYAPTPAALPPADRKKRDEIKPSERWTSIASQLMLPLPTATDAAPLSLSWIYRK